MNNLLKIAIGLVVLYLVCGAGYLLAIAPGQAERRYSATLSDYEVYALPHTSGAAPSRPVGPSYRAGYPLHDPFVGEFLAQRTKAVGVGALAFVALIGLTALLGGFHGLKTEDLRYAEPSTAAAEGSTEAG